MSCAAGSVSGTPRLYDRHDPLVRGVYNGPLHVGIRSQRSVSMRQRTQVQTLLRRAAAVVPAAFTPAERESALGKLMTFCARPEFAEHVRAATGAYEEASGDRIWDAGVEPDNVDVELPLWFATAWPVDGRSTPIDLLLSRRGWTLSSGEREFLRRLAAAGVRVYEIVRVHPGEGFEAMDLCSDEPVRVSERLGTSQLVAWDVLACRLIDSGAGLIIEGAALRIPRQDKDPLLQGLKLALERYVADGTGSHEAFFRHAAPLFVRTFLDESVKSRKLPEIRTGDGEQLMFAKAVFSVKDAGALRRALRECPVIDADEDGRRFTLLREEKNAPACSERSSWTKRGCTTRRCRNGAPPRAARSSNRLLAPP